MALTPNSLEDIIEKTVVELYRIAETILPNDVKEALMEAYKREINPVAKSILSAILENVELAEKESIPICQDTGTPIFYLELGENFPIRARLREIIIRGTRRATREVPLRPNTVNPLTGANPGDNTGRFIPYIEWDIVEGDSLKITVLPKGGGSEFTTQLKNIASGLGIKGVKRTVIEAIFEAGGRPCPPIIVGVGIGGSADIALKLAKKAILRPINVRHQEPEIAKLEEELYNALNQLGIGPMGLGGNTTVLGVNIEYAYRHPALIPIGIATQCWAARRASAQISSDGRVEILSHDIKID